MPLPPMSTPKPCTRDRVVIVPPDRSSCRSPAAGSRPWPATAARPTPPPTCSNLAVAVAREAADLVAAGPRRGREHVDVKSSPVDMVTAVDPASEAAVVGRLLARPPGRRRAGGGGCAARGHSGVRWVVDPIDGTVNFLYGVPAYAVSIAAEVDGVVRAGAVLNGPPGELFTATYGGGA